MVVLEAMASGLPVLLAEEVGLAYEIEQAKSGIVVNSNQAEVGRVWQELLLQTDLRRSMGKSGLKLVHERFDSNIVASKMINLLQIASRTKY